MGNKRWDTSCLIRYFRQKEQNLFLFFLIVWLTSITNLSSRTSRVHLLSLSSRVSLLYVCSNVLSASFNLALVLWLFLMSFFHNMHIDGFSSFLFFFSRYYIYKRKQIHYKTLINFRALTNRWRDVFAYRWINTCPSLTQEKWCY